MKLQKYLLCTLLLGTMAIQCGPSKQQNSTPPENKYKKGLYGYTVGKYRGYVCKKEITCQSIAQAKKPTSFKVKSDDFFMIKLEKTPEISWEITHLDPKYILLYSSGVTEPEKMGPRPITFYGWEFKALQDGETEIRIQLKSGNKSFGERIFKITIE